MPGVPPNTALEAIQLSQLLSHRFPALMSSNVHPPSSLASSW